MIEFTMRPVSTRVFGDPSEPGRVFASLRASVDGAFGGGVPGALCLKSAAIRSPTSESALRTVIAPRVRVACKNRRRRSTYSLRFACHGALECSHGALQTHG